MPRVVLSDEEFKELSEEPELTEDDNESMEAGEYLEARDRLIAKAKAEGDEDRVGELLDRFPHPGQLEQDERESQARKLREEDMAARRPDTPEKQAAYLKGLDEVPDGDLNAMKAYMAQHGMYDPIERGEEV